MIALEVVPLITVTFIVDKNKQFIVRNLFKQGKQVIQSMTWKPNEKMTPKQVEKELNRQTVMFEEICLKGFQSKAVKFKTIAEE